MGREQIRANGRRDRFLTEVKKSKADVSRLFKLSEEIIKMTDKKKMDEAERFLSNVTQIPPLFICNAVKELKLQAIDKVLKEFSETLKSLNSKILPEFSNEIIK